MPLITVPRLHYPPLLPYLYGNTVGISTGASNTIDATGEKYAMIFHVPKTGTIDRVRFGIKTVTTSESLTVTLQTVDATTGVPTGTAYGGSSSETIATPAADTIYTVTFGTPASATVGDVVAIVIEFTSTAGNLAFSRTTGSTANCATAYYALYTSSWAKQTLGTPLFSVIYSDDTTEPIGILPAMVTSSSYTITSTTTPDEMGLRFKMPFTARAVGAIGWIAILADAREVSYKLYSDDGTLLASVTPDSGQTGGNGYVLQLVRFSSAVTLSRGSWYRLTYAGQAASGGAINDMRFTDSKELGMFAGADCYQCYRTDAGAFTDDASRFTPVHLMFDAVDIPGVYMVNE